ncbi:hypothetical protein U3A55_11055 [Salarchaeum sp. III]|uniref:DUF7090 family protein n=1 Tax=Salarchaeum sp. III TaxID=3107927 RepID=UPI002ED8D7EE
MDYELAIDGGPASIPGGTAVLLLHPSTAETDRIDTDFLKTDTDRFLVISTRTTAREVEQKLDYYGVAEPRSAANQNARRSGDGDESRAYVLDALSVDRGYSRRGSEHIRYVSSPDDVEGIIAVAEDFLEGTTGKRRVSFDSVTELAYYADEERALDALDRLGDLLTEHDAVGLFHVSTEVHDPDVIERFREHCGLVVELDGNGSVTVSDP